MLERSRRKLDWIILAIWSALMLIGWLMIYAVGYENGYEQGITDFLIDTEAGKQLIWIVAATILLFFVTIIDWKFWRTFAYPAYGFGILLLVLVLVFGKTIKGATSWFSFGSFSIQPSEIAKFTTALGLSAFLATVSTDLRFLRSQLLAIAIFAAPALIILLQPDAGSTLVFLALFLPLYREGFPASFFALVFYFGGLLLLALIFPPSLVFSWLCFVMIAYHLRFLKSTQFFAGLIGLLAAAVALYFAQAFIPPLYLAGGTALALAGVLSYQFFKTNRARMATVMGSALLIGTGLMLAANFAFNNLLKSHQQDRLNVWLNPEKCDPQGSLYNLEQSKMAIAAGGLVGKGFLGGEITKGNYVPEQSTDFIYTTIAEEHGFIGTLAVLALYLGLLFRVVYIAERQRLTFSRVYAYCVAAFLFIHIFINIGMTMGLMPIIGIPLPFISKGGSSLIGFTLLIGVLVRLDQYR